MFHTVPANHSTLVNGVDADFLSLLLFPSIAKYGFFSMGVSLQNDIETMLRINRPFHHALSDDLLDYCSRRRFGMHNEFSDQHMVNAGAIIFDKARIGPHFAIPNHQERAFYLLFGIMAFNRCRLLATTNMSTFDLVVRHLDTTLRDYMATQPIQDETRQKLFRLWNQQLYESIAYWRKMKRELEKRLPGYIHDTTAVQGPPPTTYEPPPLELATLQPPPAAAEPLDRLSPLADAIHANMQDEIDVTLALPALPPPDPHDDVDMSFSTSSSGSLSAAVVPLNSHSSVHDM